MKTTRADIEAALWRGANTFRGIIDAANYKDYVLSMLFVKYLSDTYKENVENLKFNILMNKDLKEQNQDFHLY